MQLAAINHCCYQSTWPVGRKLILVLGLTNPLGHNLMPILALANPFGCRLMSALVLSYQLSQVPHNTFNLTLLGRAFLIAPGCFCLNKWQHVYI